MELKKKWSFEGNCREHERPSKAVLTGWSFCLTLMLKHTPQGKKQDKTTTKSKREGDGNSVRQSVSPSLLLLSLFLPDCSPALIMGSSFKHIKSDGWWYLPPVWCSTSSNYWRKKIKGGCVWPDNIKLNS